MRAIERTTGQFVASVRHAIPDAKIHVDRSVTWFGRSNYVYLQVGERPARLLKVRISDHPVGMRRARSGQEALYLHARAKPAQWAVWLSELVALLHTPQTDQSADQADAFFSSSST